MDYFAGQHRRQRFQAVQLFLADDRPLRIWAIEYAYKPFSGGTEGEVAELKKIAARSAEPLLAYATDEDTRGIDPDPLGQSLRPGERPHRIRQGSHKLIGELWPGLVDRVTEKGDGYERARQAFGVLLGNYGRAVYFAARNIGGLNVNRDHKGDPNGRSPYVVVPVAKQRKALGLLEQQVFSDKPFSFPPELYNHLASSHWDHWGSDLPLRTDYAVHDVIGMWQDRILSQITGSLTLTRCTTPS